MTQKIEIGTDIIDIERFRNKQLSLNQSFYNSTFTKSELDYCQKYSDPYIHLAGIFAAKEAVIKCLNKAKKFSDIEISWNSDRKPHAIIYPERINALISISHTKTIAISVALILRD